MVCVEGCVCVCPCIDMDYVYMKTLVFFFKYSKLVQTSSGRSCLTTVKQNGGICLV